MCALPSPAAALPCTVHRYGRSAPRYISDKAARNGCLLVGVTHRRIAMHWREGGECTWRLRERIVEIELSSLGEEVRRAQNIGVGCI